MTKHAVYPGSFNPFTLGHLDIVKRSVDLFALLTITVVHNPNKSTDTSAATRIELIKTAVSEAGLNSAKLRFEVLESGLLANFCKEIGATVIVKGIRNGVDIDYEVPMATVNRDLTGVETVFLSATPALAHISSSLVRQVAELGGDVSAYVPVNVAEYLKKGR